MPNSIVVTAKRHVKMFQLGFQTVNAPRYFVSFLGAFGALLSVAGCLGVWYAEARIDGAREHVFETVDQSLSNINRRVIETQDLAAKSKITLEEIKQRLPEWTKKEASERLAVRFDVEAKAQQLTAGLRQAELLCELSQDMVHQVRQLLEVGDQLGLSWKAESVDPLLERVAEIKQDLNQAIHTAETLRLRLGEGRDDESVAERAEQALTVAARLLTTFGSVDSRLASLQDRLIDAQDVISELSAKTHVRIVAVAVCATLLLLWMAAGQLCLWRHARKR